MNIKNIILPAALIFASIASAATTPAAESVPQTAPAEKSWTHSVDFGLAFPIAKYKVDGKKVGTVSYTLDINYLGVARNGFSLGGSFAGGYSTTDDIKFEGGKDDLQMGRYTSLDLGIGYTFGAGKSFSLSVLGTVGYEIVYFESESHDYKHEELGDVDRYFGEAIGGVTVGGDVIAHKTLSPHWGVYAGVSGRWITKSVSMSTVTYEKDDFTRTDTSVDDDNSGLYSIVPAVGATLRF